MINSEKTNYTYFVATSCLVLCGFKDVVVIYHTIHLVWSQEPGQHCTYSGSF
jgi:hypothetical protein